MCRPRCHMCPWSPARASFAGLGGEPRTRQCCHCSLRGCRRLSESSLYICICVVAMVGGYSLVTAWKRRGVISECQLGRLVQDCSQLDAFICKGCRYRASVN